MCGITRFKQDEKNGKEELFAGWIKALFNPYSADKMGHLTIL